MALILPNLIRVRIGVLKPPVTPGSQIFTTSGTFVVPAFNTLLIQLVGAGGHGERADQGQVHGGTTTIASLNLVANGGRSPIFSGPHTGGTASGGDTNTTGGSGVVNGSVVPGGNAAGPFGGAGAASIGANGAAPGGGGHGYYTFGDTSGGSGGGGGYCAKTYTAQSIPIGTVLTVTVAAANGAYPLGVGAGNNEASGGGRGEARFTWS